MVLIPIGLRTAARCSTTCWARGGRNPCPCSAGALMASRGSQRTGAHTASEGDRRPGSIRPQGLVADPAGSRHQPARPASHRWLAAAAPAAAADPTSRLRRSGARRHVRARSLHNVPRMRTLAPPGGRLPRLPCARSLAGANPDPEISRPADPHEPRAPVTAEIRDFPFKGTTPAPSARGGSAS
jgi:hypothetical protein